VDANTEFAAVEHGGDFLNSAMGYSPTILKLPTYPQPRPSLNVFFQPNPRNSVGLGLYDTAGPGAMPILELGHRWQVGDRRLDGRAAAGFWWQTGHLRCFDGDQISGTKGFYLVYEQGLWKKRTPVGADAPVHDVFAFLQYGHASGDVSNFTDHLGGGLVWRGPLRRRATDSLGAGASWVHLTDQPEAGFEKPGEMAVETFYKVQISRNLSISPDVQFIHNPGGLRCQRDSVVFTPRLTLSF
jgi:porin